MKIMKTRYFKQTLAIALLLAAGLSAGAQTLREEDSKTYTATSSTELSIDNQFGKITVTDWDQNKVEITYITEVTMADEAKARKLMDKIKIDFKEDGKSIKVTTNIGEHGNLNLHNDKDKKQSFSITYIVKCPKNIKVSLENQFGDIILGTLTGTVKVDLQFGNLIATSLTGTESKFDMQFGDVTIGTLKDAKIDVQHCDLLKITECDNLSIDGQFTEVEIGSVGKLKCDLNNCKLSVESVSDLLKLDCNMGNVKIDNVAASFKSVAIEQNMGDVALTIDQKAGYTLNAEANMGSIKVPEGFKESKQKEEEVPGLTVDKVSGTFGNGTSTIKINTNMGSVKIK